MADIKIMKDGVDMMAVWRQRAKDAHAQKPYWERVDRYERRARAATLSDRAVAQIAQSVAHHGPRQYGPEDLLSTFGEDGFNVVVSDSPRFLSALRAAGYELGFAVLPRSRPGFEVMPFTCPAARLASS